MITPLRANHTLCHHLLIFSTYYWSRYKGLRPRVLLSTDAPPTFLHGFSVLILIKAVHINFPAKNIENKKKYKF